jgi:hypothetical protein
MNKPIRLDAEIILIARFVRHCACIHDVRPLSLMGVTLLLFCLKVNGLGDQDQGGMNIRDDLMKRQDMIIPELITREGDGAPSLYTPTQCNVSIAELRNKFKTFNLGCGTQHIEVNCMATATQVVPTEVPTLAPTAPAYQHLLQTLKQGERAYTVFITLDMTKMKNDLQQAYYNNCAEQEKQMIQDAPLPIWDSILIDSVFRSDVHPKARLGLTDFFKTENTTLYLLQEGHKVIKSWKLDDYWGEITEYSNNLNHYSISFNRGSKVVALSTQKNMCTQSNHEPAIEFELPLFQIGFDSSLINTYNSGSATNVLENLFTVNLDSTEQPVQMRISCRYGGYESPDESCDVFYSVDSKIDFETRQYVDKSRIIDGQREEQEQINHDGTKEDQGDIEEF